MTALARAAARTRAVRLTLVPAAAADAAALAALKTGVADDLTRRYGRGHWSGAATEKGILHAMRTSRVFVARSRGRIIATLRLATRKPWAIDTTYFTPCKTPLYLSDMAVVPGRQGSGIGTRCLEEAERIARAWPAEAIRLDAYDAEAGAGGFYAGCGYREMGRVVYRRTSLIYYERMLD